MKNEEEKNELMAPLPLGPELAIALFQSEKAESEAKDLLAKIEESALAFVTTDATTAAGRDEIKSVAYRVARTKTTLDDIGKAQVADLKAKTKRIDGIRKLIRDTLDELKERIRKPVTEFEEREKKRIAGHQSTLLDLESLGKIPFGVTLESLETSLNSVDTFDVSTMEEFEERAKEVSEKTRSILTEAIRAKKEEIRQAEELERLKREQAEKDAEFARLRELEEKQKREQEAAKQSSQEKTQPTSTAQEEPIPSPAPAPQPSSSSAATNHKREINLAALADLRSAVPSIDDGTAKAILTAIIQGKIRAVSIAY